MRYRQAARPDASPTEEGVVRQVLPGEIELHLLQHRRMQVLALCRPGHLTPRRSGPRAHEHRLQRRTTDLAAGTRTGRDAALDKALRRLQLDRLGRRRVRGRGGGSLGRRLRGRCYGRRGGHLGRLARSHGLSGGHSGYGGRHRRGRFHDGLRRYGGHTRRPGERMQAPRVPLRESRFPRVRRQMTRSAPSQGNPHKNARKGSPTTHVVRALSAVHASASSLLPLERP